MTAPRQPYGPTSELSASTRRAGTWMRWALALLGSAGFIGVGWFLGGGQGDLLGAPVAIGLQVLAITLAALGLAAAYAAVLSLSYANGRRRALAAGVAALVAIALLVVLLLVPVLVLLAGVLAVGALVVAVGSGGEAPDSRPFSPLHRVALALPFVALTLIVVTAGSLQIVVWNPLAKVPGLSLDEIHAAMAAAQESSSPIPVLVWAVFWVAVAVVLVVASAIPRLAALLPSRRIVVLGLVLVGAAASFHWMAAFGMGMSLADTFATSGGDAAPGGAIIALVGQAALVAALFVGLVPRARIR